MSGAAANTIGKALAAPHRNAPDEEDRVGMAWVEEEIVEAEVAAVQSEDEKLKKSAKSIQEAKLDEFGGPTTFRKLFGLATTWEMSIFVVGVLAAIVHGLGQPLLCTLFGDLIDAVGADDTDADAFLDEVSRLSIIFCLIGVGVTISGLLQGFCFSYFNELQVKKMRPLYFGALLSRDVGWFDTHEVGALPTEMDEDLEVYREGLGTKLGVSVESLSTAVFGYIFGLVLSWQVALVMTAMLPIMFVGVVMMGKSVMDVQQEKQGAYAQAAQQMDEVLYAVRTVVSLGGERKELRRYADSCDVARRGGILTRIRMGVGMGYIFLCFILSFSLAFYVGMRLVYDGVDLSVGRMIAAFFCVVTAGFTLGQVPPGFVGFSQARFRMARFFHISEHDAVIERRISEDRSPCPPIETLALESVHFSYPARPAIKILNGLDMSISKGQKVAVVGESGSGKSTVMALLERFYDPQQGRVLVNGLDLRNFSVSSFRSHIGYVGQEPVLFATSIKDNIMQGAPPEATMKDVQRVAKYAQLDFVERLPQRLETYVGTGGSQFSGGQKQRIAIARALMKRPSVLFLDEATSALDSTSEKMIQDTIDSIGSSSNELGGMTIVTIAHRLSTIRNSDVIYVLKDGAVVEQGSHTELAARAGGVYQGLAAAQAMAAPGGADEKDSTGGAGAGGGESAVVLARQLSPDSRTAEGPGGAVVKLSEEDLEAQRQKEVLKTYKVPMLRLLGFCRPEWWAFAPGLLAAGLSGATFPVMAAYVIVTAMVGFMDPDPEKMREEVEQSCILFCVIAVVRFLAVIGQFTFFAILGEAMTMRARTTMLTSIFRQEIGFHDAPDNTPARLVKALQLYAFRISSLCTSVGDTADALMSVLAGVIIGFVNEWRMAAVMMLSIPIFGVAQAIQISASMGATQKEGGAQKEAAQLVSESLSSAQTVHAAGNRRDVVALYAGLIEEKGNALARTSFIGGLSYGISKGVMFWVLAAGFWFMGWLINNEGADFQDCMRAFLGIMYAGMGAGMAFALTGDAGKAKVAAHDMFELVDRPSAINGLEPDGVSLPDSREQVGRIEFKDVSFFYPFRPEVQVLSKLSFTIEAGQSVGIVGPSGGGKSTIFAMMQRFYDPLSGSVLVGRSRTPLSSVNVRSWRQQVGFVGQEPILFDTSVLENVVGYGLEDGNSLPVSAERLEEVKRMAKLSFLDGRKAQGWATQVGPRGARLSGGQKQRVAIARALVRNPPILLLDEATSALDTQSERVVSRALEAARQGRTSFAIAHRLSTIQDCDVILVVAEGVLVERGSHDELMQRQGVYFKLRGENWREAPAE